MKTSIGQSELEIAQGDITSLPVDAIVNAANQRLQHGGGVALAISRKGGPVIQKESNALVAKQGPLDTGDAVITTAGDLPAAYVIHTVGPIWGVAEPSTSDDQLRRAIGNSLELAEQKGLSSIAFPAISTGIYRFPVDRAARLMLEEAATVLKGKTTVRRVIFCLFDEPTYQVFVKALGEME